MSDHFRSIDLTEWTAPGSAEHLFTFADVPAASGIPFAIVHLKNGSTRDKTVRMDLDKRVFLDAVSDPLRVAAAPLAQHISGLAFCQPQPSLAAGF